MDRDRPTGAGRRQHWRLRMEFGLLFVAAPVAIAVFLPPAQMFGALFAVTALGLALLTVTPGFRWQTLWIGWQRIDARAVLGLGALSSGIGFLVLGLVAPQDVFGLYRLDLRLFVLVMLLYPFLSALPQELVFRLLFFVRYRRILPAGRAALILNAALFSLAHLMYWSWIVAALTFAGGLVFAATYEARGLPAAWVMHAVAGNTLFTVGMGAFFFSGNVVRPF